MVTSQDKDQDGNHPWLKARIFGVITLSVGIVVLSWMNPNLRPLSRTPAPESETARASFGPAKDTKKFDFGTPAAMTPERIRLLLDAARRRVDAGDPVPGALPALQTLTGGGEGPAAAENPAAAERVLSWATFNAHERPVLACHVGFAAKAA